MQRIILQKYLKRINWAKGDERRDRKNSDGGLSLFSSTILWCMTAQVQGNQAQKTAAFGFPAHAGEGVIDDAARAFETWI